MAGKEEIPKLAMPKEGTSLLFAACNGITEMVEEILKKFPMAIHDTSENKNMILWVVEHRQPRVYELLLKSDLRRDSMFQTKDTYGNSALHLAAMLREHKALDNSGGRIANAMGNQVVRGMNSKL